MLICLNVNAKCHHSSRVVVGMGMGVGVMVFNATFNNGTVISVLFVEETGVPENSHRLAASH